MWPSFGVGLLAGQSHDWKDPLFTGARPSPCFLAHSEPYESPSIVKEDKSSLGTSSPAALAPWRAGLQ